MITEALLIEAVQSTGLTNMLLIFYGLLILEIKANVRRLFDKDQDAKYIEYVPLRVDNVISKDLKKGTGKKA